MTELKKVWVTDQRDKDADPFLYPEHLLKFSKHLKKASRPKPRQQTKVTEPAAANTSTSKAKEKN
jgi:hypothetical protein